MKAFTKLLKLALFVAVSAITLMSVCFMVVVVQFIVDMIMGAVFSDYTGILYGLVYYIIIMPLGGVMLMPYFLAFKFLGECAERL